MASAAIPEYQDGYLLVFLLGSIYGDQTERTKFLARVEALSSPDPTLASDQTRTLTYVAARSRDAGRSGQSSISDVYDLSWRAQERGWMAAVFMDDLSFRQFMGVPGFGEHASPSCICTYPPGVRQTLGQHGGEVSPEFVIRRMPWLEILTLKLLRPVQSTQSDSRERRIRFRSRRFYFSRSREVVRSNLYDGMKLRDPFALPFTNSRAFPSASELGSILAQVRPRLPFEIVTQIERQSRVDDSIRYLTEAYDICRIDKPDHNANPMDVIALCPLTSDQVMRFMDWLTSQIERLQGPENLKLSVRFHKWRASFPASRRDMCRIFDWYKLLSRPTDPPRHESHFALFVNKPFNDTPGDAKRLIWGISGGGDCPEVFERGNVFEYVAAWLSVSVRNGRDSPEALARGLYEVQREVIWPPFETFPRTVNTESLPPAEMIRWTTVLGVTLLD